jgi:hypothetical protein
VALKVDVAVEVAVSARAALDRADTKSAPGGAVRVDGAAGVDRGVKAAGADVAAGADRGVRVARADAAVRVGAVRAGAVRAVAAVAAVAVATV